MIECPQHHQSETADYCSVCGTQIETVPVEIGVADPIGGCPACNAARESDQQIFCEACGFNFRTATPAAPLPAAPVILPAPPAVVIPALDPPVAPAFKRWDAILSVDANLYGSPNADAPVDRPEQVFTLFETESILGRATPGLRLQIPIISDGGVSRRHAVLLRSDAGLAVRDLGSANGTQLNGAELIAGVDTSLKNGDVLAVGAWTRITIKAVTA